MNRSPIRYTLCDAPFHCPVQCEHSLRSKAIFRTNDADLIACMQAEVVSTGVQNLPQLRPLAKIT